MIFNSYGRSVWILSLLSQVNGILYPYEPRGPLQGEIPPPGTPWPIPRKMESTSERVSISRFTFTSNVKVPCEPLEFAFEKYSKYEFNFIPIETPDPNFPSLKNVQVTINSEVINTGCLDYPQFTEDTLNEHYELKIGVDGNGAAVAFIETMTIWGALRGIETFSQLIWSNNNYEDYHYYLNHTNIIDWPRFAWRGLMIDTARHYLPQETITQILDGMLYNKLNVLHWHIVDDQSFPYVSKKFPQLSEKGGYKNGMLVYTPETIEQVTNDARVRGIRVIFEFDTPGHTGGFGKAFPELLTPCYGNGTAGTPNYPYHAARENFDPTNEDVYEFIRDFFFEIVSSVSNDAFVHLGMDEVYKPCWESSPVIREFMDLNNYTSYGQVQEHYTKRHLEMVRSLGASMVVWEDPIDEGVVMDKDIIIQAWKDWPDWPSRVQNILNLGHRVILSSCWYVNYIAYGEKWKDYYKCDPILDLPFITEDQKHLVLGGEAAIWGEFVDRTNIIPRLFPFVGAVAEKLWSRANVSSVEDAMHRLDQHRCRMLQRGLQAQPILNGYCEQGGVF